MLDEWQGPELATPSTGVRDSVATWLTTTLTGVVESTKIKYVFLIVSQLHL